MYKQHIRSCTVHAVNYVCSMWKYQNLTYMKNVMKTYAWKRQWLQTLLKYYYYYYYYCYYICLKAFFLGQPGYAGTRKVNYAGSYWSKRWWGGSGIGCTICKSSAPHSRQITTPIRHPQFLQARRPFCRQTNSVKALKAYKHYWNRYSKSKEPNWKKLGLKSVSTHASQFVQTSNHATENKKKN